MPIPTTHKRKKAKLLNNYIPNDASITRRVNSVENDRNNYPEGAQKQIPLGDFLRERKKLTDLPFTYEKHNSIGTYFLDGQPILYADMQSKTYYQ